MLYVVSLTLFEVMFVGATLGSEKIHACQKYLSKTFQNVVFDRKYT